MKWDCRFFWICRCKSLSAFRGAIERPSNTPESYVNAATEASATLPKPICAQATSKLAGECVITKECRFHSMTLHKSVILYTSINVRAVDICMVSRMARNALYRTFLCRFAINLGGIGAILTGFALIIGAAKLSKAFCVPRIDQARRIVLAVPIPYRYTIRMHVD